jgi:hypothetical protein
MFETLDVVSYHSDVGIEVTRFKSDLHRRSTEGAERILETPDVVSYHLDVGIEVTRFKSDLHAEARRAQRG